MLGDISIKVIEDESNIKVDDLEYTQCKGGR
jgi:hypothetical protein